MDDPTPYAPTPYLASRYGEHLEERDRVTGALWDHQTAKALRLADRIADCCQTPQLHASEGHDSIRIFEMRCRSRLCPICRKQHARRYMQAALEHLRMMDSPRLLTLTLASSDDPLRMQLQRLRGAFARLRRHKLWAANVEGGICTVEITFNKRTRQWHPHLHAIIDASFMKQSRLSEAWKSITTDSFIVDIRLVRSLKEAARYIASYIGKSNDCRNYPTERLAEWIDNVRSMRMLSTFGKHHGLLTSDPDADEGPETATDTPIVSLNRLMRARDDGDPDAAVLLAAINVQMTRQARERDTGPSPETQELCRRLVDRLIAWDRDYRIVHPSSAPPRRDPALENFTLYDTPP